MNRSAAVSAAQQQRRQQPATECDGWAEAGECERNPGWMLANCAKECASRDPPLPPLAGAAPRAVGTAGANAARPRGCRRVRPAQRPSPSAKR